MSDRSIVVTFGARVIDIDSNFEQTDALVLRGCGEELDDELLPSVLASSTGVDFARGSQLRLRYCDDRRRLVLEILLSSRKPIGDDDRARVAAVLGDAIDNGLDQDWEFHLPIDNHRVHIECEPLGDAVREGAGRAEAVFAKWRGWKPATLAQLTDDALRALLAELEPHLVRSYRATGLAAEIFELTRAVEALLQRRAVDRAGVPKVDLDDLDALDDLPDDVF